jgi:hypothetical protein
MHQRLTTIFLGAVFTLVLGGCESHQAKVNALEKEHDRIGQEYKKDCGDEYLKARPQFSQKCVDEAKQMDDLWKQLQAEKTK